MQGNGSYNLELLKQENGNEDYMAPPITLHDRAMKFKARAVHALRCVQILLITSNMAYSECNNHVTLLVCAVAGVIGCVLDLYEYHNSLAGSIAVGVYFVAYVSTGLALTRKIEHMETIAAKYRSADDVLQLGALAEAEAKAGGAHANVCHLGPHTQMVDNLRQPSKEAASLQWLVREAGRLSENFEKVVLWRLHGAISGGDGEEGKRPKSNLKSTARAHEKAVLDYGKDNRFLKDMLRGSIVCKDVRQICLVWAALEQLETEGVLRILQVKNRFRGKPLATGYRDINCNVLFGNLICEIQLHCEAHYSLKDEQHSVYALCRSFGLLGDIGTELAPHGPGRQQKQHWMLTVLIFNMRISFGILLNVWGWGYAVAGFYSDYYMVLHTYDGWTRSLKTLSLCVPCWIASAIFMNDVYLANKRAFILCMSLAVTLLVVPVLLYEHYIPLIAITAPLVPIVVFLFNRASANCRASGGIDTVEKPSRVALLYIQYFGVGGKLFNWKMIIMTILEVGLQARSKLISIGMVVSNEFSLGYYWAFFALLTLNAILPPMMMSSSSLWMRRQGVLLLDVVCGVCYIVAIVIFTQFYQWDPSGVVPSDIISVAANVFPALRVLSVCRIVESGRLGQPEAGAKENRLPMKNAAFAACVGVLVLVAVALFGQAGVYPLNQDSCRPCECDANGILQSCPRSAGLSHLWGGKGRLRIARRGITGFAPGALREIEHVQYLDLSWNGITKVEAGVFSNLPHLKWVSFYSNFVDPSVLEYIHPTSYASGINSVEAGAFVNVTGLEWVILDFNDLQSVDSLAGVLDLDCRRVGLRLLGNGVSCEVTVNATACERKCEEV
jgi:hypothetical protein